MSEAEKKYGMMPFSLRNFEEEGKARLGITECVKHDLMEPYPVYYDKDGEFVAEFKFTVLIMPNNTMKITGLPVDLEAYQSENSITDEATKVIGIKWSIEVESYVIIFGTFFSKALLALSLVTKKKKPKAKKDKKPAEAAAAEEPKA